MVSKVMGVGMTMEGMIETVPVRNREPLGGTSEPAGESVVSAPAQLHPGCESLRYPFTAT
jgi:hypothetical protein